MWSLIDLKFNDSCFHFNSLNCYIFAKFDRLKSMGNFFGFGHHLTMKEISVQYADNRMVSPYARIHYCSISLAWWFAYYRPVHNTLDENNILTLNSIHIVQFSEENKYSQKIFIPIHSRLVLFLLFNFIVEQNAGEWARWVQLKPCFYFCRMIAMMNWILQTCS